MSLRTSACDLPQKLHMVMLFGRATGNLRFAIYDLRLPTANGAVHVELQRTSERFSLALSERERAAVRVRFEFMRRLRLSCSNNHRSFLRGSRNFLAGLHHLIHQAVSFGLLGRHEVVTVGVLANVFDGFAGVFGEDFV